MDLQDIVEVSVTAETSSVAQAGFGIPLLLSANAGWVERTREYKTLSALAVDFATTTPEYAQASKLFSQKPRPEKVVVGRLANKPTQRYTVSVVAVANSTKYLVRVRANWAEFISDANATNDEIVAGLVAAINGLTGDTKTASAVGGAGVQTVQLLGNAADFDGVEVGDRALLAVVQDHADPGVAADLTAIKLERNNWYAILNSYNSKAMADAIAAWAEANAKLFVADSNDSVIATTVLSGVDDMGEALRALGYDYSFVAWHPSSDAFFAAALLGARLPTVPGSETWKFAQLVGVTAYTLTDTERSNALAKNVMLYQEVAGVSITQEGKVASGEWIDVVRGLDWLKARIAENVFRSKVNSLKVPFTDSGIATVEADVRATLDEAVKNGLLVDDFEVTVPKAADVSAADKSARVLPDVEFTATLQGAIHKTKVHGSVSA